MSTVLDLILLMAISKQAVELAPNNPDYLSGLGSILSTQQRLREAEGYLVQAVEKHVPRKGVDLEAVSKPVSTDLLRLQVNDDLSGRVLGRQVLQLA